jgi:hypothetical protein
MHVIFVEFCFLNVRRRLEVPSRWVTWVIGSRVADAYGENKKRNVYTDSLQRGLHMMLRYGVR